MRRLALLAIVGLAGACSVVTTLDGLRGAASDAGTNDASAGVDGAVDAAPDAPPPCNPGTAPDLVGYYTFDEGIGTILLDCSGKGHDGTVLRVGPSTWATGVKGGGLRVVAPDGCAELPASPDFEMKSGLTAMAWVFVNAYPATPTLLGIVGKSADLLVSGWRVYSAVVEELGTAVARPGDAGLLYASIDPIAAKAWHHIAARYESGKSEMFYVDGVEVSNRGWATPLIEDKAANVRIGCRSDNGGFFDGTIDEVRIYARALTPTEIAILSAKP